MDFELGLELVPQSVDLVQDDDTAGFGSGIVAREVASPDVEIGLRHAGIGGQQEQDGVRVGQQVERQLRFGADCIQSGCVENHEALLEQRVRKIDDRVAPARDFDRHIRFRGFVAVSAFDVESEFLRHRGRHMLHLRHA